MLRGWFCCGPAGSFSLVFPRILARMRQKVRDREFVITRHARQEMDEDSLTVYDIERAILSGDITERQKDRSTADRKYRIRGGAILGDPIEVVAKIGLTGRLFIITVYRLDR